MVLVLVEMPDSLENAEGVTASTGWTVTPMFKRRVLAIVQVSGGRDRRRVEVVRKSSRSLPEGGWKQRQEVAHGWTDGQTEPLWVGYSEQRGSLRQGTLVEIWARWNLYIQNGTLRNGWIVLFQERKSSLICSESNYLVQTGSWVTSKGESHV